MIPLLDFMDHCFLMPHYLNKISFTIGFKYYNVHYNYSSKGGNGKSSESIVNNPDGSGIDFGMGFYYHF